MAAPRCMRSLLGPVKCTKIAHASRPFSTTAARPVPQDDRRARKAMNTLTANIENGEMTLEERLQDMNMDPAEFKTLWNSQRRIAKENARREPKTREEARKMLEELQSKPDNLFALQMYKARGVLPIENAKERGITLDSDKKPLDAKTQAALDAIRQPVNVEAVNLRPLRRAPQFGIPVCDLQLRTYSIRNLELFADFAVRAAYYMGLAARGPVPLPRITERWTVPRSHFIFKKSQENFERVTMRRLIQIQDGHPDVVKAWLAFLAEHQYHGVGMKANIWEYEDLETATRAGEAIAPDDVRRRREGPMMKKVDEILNSKGYKEAMKGHKTSPEIEFRR